MSKLDILIIDYKKPELYFKGFYNDAQVGSYGFQLQRMFDFNNAIQGEYMVVSLDNKPFMQIHVERTNSFRVLTKPNFAIDIEKETIDKYILEGYKLILDHLKEFYDFTPSRLKFEIEIDNNCLNYNEVLEFLKERGYKVIEKFNNYLLSIDSLDPKPLDYDSILFSDLEIEKRFDLLYQYCPKADGIEKDRFYQDYLEQDTIAEELWKLYKINDVEIGFILYGVDSGFMKTTSILEIRSFDKKNNDLLSNIGLNEVYSIAKEYGSNRIKIKSSKDYFKDLEPMFEESVLS
ncbi:MAG: hypothetical protein CR982_06650 [Candidatus Cloacimonadota bacterium]|nr:MAG: hypothetical protein CR982_06650 [Candidatus Cloacimonadota bacterium]PIE77838.1 MAG: hypothetical protein CSA15_11115 [Candidatus Delongbacteria bacterium]